MLVLETVAKSCNLRAVPLPLQTPISRGGCLGFASGWMRRDGPAPLRQNALEFAAPGSGRDGPGVAHVELSRDLGKATVLTCA